MFQVNAYDKTLLLIFSYSVSFSLLLLLFLSFFCNIQNYDNNYDNEQQERVMITCESVSL